MFVLVDMEFMFLMSLVICVVNLVKCWSFLYINIKFSMESFAFLMRVSFFLYFVVILFVFKLEYMNGIVSMG